MLVHQLNYTALTLENYPVETLVAGNGDCDIFSLLAASILKAGGFDVVLLYYSAQSHMNIGVHLTSPPEDIRKSVSPTPYSVTADNIKYYVGECTGNSSSWITQWRIGECPEEFKGINPQIIPITDNNQVSPGQVSASYTTLNPSQLSLGTSSIISPENYPLTINGQIDPSLQGQTVTLYAKSLTGDWQAIGTVTTAPDGQFVYTWNCSLIGLCYVQASWSGNNQYTSAISTPQLVVILPLYLIAAIILGIAVAIIALTAYVVHRHKHPKLPEGTALGNQVSM
jgi:hypothetical protein